VEEVEEMAGERIIVGFHFYSLAQDGIVEPVEED
jgi:hypothetical protein